MEQMRPENKQKTIISGSTDQLLSAAPPPAHTPKPKNVATTFLHNLVHQFDQVALLVLVGVFFGELLDGLVNELAEGVRLGKGVFTPLVKVFKELSDVFLAVSLRVGLVEKLEHADEDFERLLNHVSLNRRVEEELLKYADGRSAELSVAKRN